MYVKYHPGLGHFDTQEISMCVFLYVCLLAPIRTHNEGQTAHVILKQHKKKSSWAQRNQTSQTIHNILLRNWAKPHSSLWTHNILTLETKHQASNPYSMKSALDITHTSSSHHQYNASRSTTTRPHTYIDPDDFLWFARFGGFDEHSISIGDCENKYRRRGGLFIQVQRER